MVSAQVLRQSVDGALCIRFLAFARLNWYPSSNLCGWNALLLEWLENFLPG